MTLELFRQMPPRAYRSLPPVMEIDPITRLFWWPHPYARPWLWRNVVLSYRYFVAGVECNAMGEPLPYITGDDLR